MVETPGSAGNAVKSFTSVQTGAAICVTGGGGGGPTMSKA